MRKKMFIADFDGTLLTDEKTIGLKDIQTLEKLQKDNVVTAIATGRSIYSYEKALGKMDLSACGNRLPVDYIIFSTGAGILDTRTGQIIAAHSIELSQIHHIAGFLNARALDYMILKAIPDTRYFLFRSFGADNPDFYRRIDLYKPFATPLTQAGQYPAAATEVLVILPREKGMHQINAIQSALSGFSVIHATSPLDHESVWIEIFHPLVSKSKAASMLAQLTGVERTETVCVGNDYNDQDLLDWAGRGYLVENGPDRLKNRYTLVASNNECGVTEAAGAAGLLD